MRKVIWLIPFVMCLALLTWLSIQPGLAESSLATTTPGSDAQATPTPVVGEALAVQQAIEQGIQARSSLAPVYLLFHTEVKHIRLNASLDWATALMILVDSETGETLPMEPGLALVQKVNGAWQVTLPGDVVWLDQLKQAPEEVLSRKDRDYWLDVYNTAQVEAVDLNFSGYYLPWKYNTDLSLSRSIAHIKDYVTAKYAFDFYHPVLDLFELYASKPGTVWSFKDDIPTCWLYHCDDQGSGNYIVLKDTSTEPASYQLYLHLAEGSIPAQLKSIGAPVGQGQFIGMADNTGASWGHHVHFHVFTIPTSAYWGASVDITFKDVDINGGRPRAIADLLYCTSDDYCDDYRTVYTSKNPQDWTAPTGKLTAPTDFALVKSGSVTIIGSAYDSGVGIKSAQLMAFYDNYWHNIGPQFTISSFSYAFDLCKAGISDGPLSIGLRVVDNAGNINSLADIVHIQKDVACPQVALPVMACVPGANEVSLYASAGWQGTCQKFLPGSYTSAGLGAVGDNNTASLQVGADVQVTLFVNADYKGRAETFWTDDGNLEDNLIGADKTSTIKVALRTIPSAPLLSWPNSGQTLSQFASLSLYWENSGGALEYQANLKSLSNGTEITSTWHSDPFWHLGTGIDGSNLVTGSYEWRVRARNGTGTGEWSTPRTFTIDETSLLLPAAKTLPFTDSFETNTNGWVGSGLWTRTSARPARNGIYTWWWGESASGDERYYSAKYGDLTSPPIQIGSSQSAFLRFAYRYQTETNQRFWDQRWVQISVDGGAFKNLYQLQEDPMNAASTNPDWMLSPYINLGEFAGHTVRLRFHFDTMDPSGVSPDNDYDGWSIDDVSITTTGPIACDNGDTEEASVLASNVGLTQAEICGPGDIDLFTFAALEGEQVVADIDAYSFGSPLDAYLFVLDSDGASALAENDDQRSGFYDPLLRFTPPRDGVYYLKLRAWDHGRTGGPEVDYTLSLHTGDVTEPVVSLVSPPDFTWVVGNPLAVTAHILETGSGIDRVEFYWHSNDWLNSYWQKLPDPVQVGEDWVTLFSPGSSGVYLAAFYVIVYDNMGLVAADVAWNVTITVDPPQQNFLPMVAR